MARIKIVNGRGIDYECPVCSDDIELGQNYCRTCGEPIEWIDHSESWNEDSDVEGDDIYET